MWGKFWAMVRDYFKNLTHDTPNSTIAENPIIKNSANWYAISG